MTNLASLIAPILLVLGLAHSKAPGDLTASVALGVPAVQGADWPSQRGDLGRRGYTLERIDARRLTIAWSWTSPQRPSPAWPGPARWDAYAGLPGLKAMRNYDPVFHATAVGDDVFFGSSSDDAVRCLDARTGEQRWLFRSGGPVRVAPTLHGDFVYFGSDDGSAYCLRKESGELVWRNESMGAGRRILSNGRVISAWPIRTGVHIDDGIAYFGASLLPWRSSYLCAVDARTGKLREGAAKSATYIHDLGTGWTLEGPLLLSPASVIVPQGRIAPLIFERATGEPKGTLEGGGGSFCLLTDDDQVLHGPGNKDGWITASTADSREKLASFARGNAIVVEGQTAFMLSDRSLVAMDRTTQTLLWSQATDTPYEVILAGDTLFCGGDGKVEARKTSDGTLLWRGAIDGRAWGLAVAQGRLLVSSDSGQVSAFHVEGGTQALPTESVEQPPVAELGPSPGLRTIAQPAALLDRWVFQTDQLVDLPLAEGDPRTAPAFVNHGKAGRDHAAPSPVRPAGRARVAQAGEMQGLVLDGERGDIEVAADYRSVAHPQKQMTAEAWVRIDKAQSWGGLIGIAQDNGDYERGWLLGYRDRKFGFALAGERGSGHLTWILAPDAFQLGSWHQVVGTYDGKTMRLFVDGEEVASSRAESGAIAYPDTAYYHLGAYRDADEYFRAKGVLAEITVHAAALTSRDVSKHWSARAALLPDPIPIVGEPEEPAARGPVASLAGQPSVRFVAAGEASVRWETHDPEVSRLELMPEGGEPFVIELEGQRRSHVVRVPGLRDRTLYVCRVLLGDGERALRSPSFECDTHFDFFGGPGADAWSSVPVTGEPQSFSTDTGALVEAWRAESPVTSGLAVVLGCSGGGDEALWLARIAQGMRGLIVVTGEAELAEQSQRLAALGPYGARMSCVTVPASGALRLPRHFANLLIVSPFAQFEGQALVLRGGRDLVRPDGGVMLLTSDTGPRPMAGFGPWKALGGEIPKWFSARREALAGAADWTHMYGRPDNSAYSGEELAGIGDTSQLELSWIGRPGPRYQTDRQNRKPAPLSSAGRLFLQGLNRVIAVDGHNGTLLWDVGLAELQRFNIPRSSSNWCADRDSLYLAMGERLHVIDAATGDERTTHSVLIPDALRERAPDASWEWGYIAQSGDLCYGSAVRSGGQFTEWWGGENWFDAKGGENAKKVCNDALFALYKDGGEARWSRSVGRIVEPTISISEGRIVFAECRAPATMELTSARVGEGLWKDLWLVCLDARTGDVLWEREANPLRGESAFYVAIGEGTVIMVTSGRHAAQGAEAPVGEYAVYAFELGTGASTWRKKFNWEVDHHGKHLSRPAIVGGSVILRPMTFDLATGEEQSAAFPAGHQCGSYACSSNAIFLRAGDMAVWDRETGTATRWSRLRPDCWISTIPAAGMLLSPEGGGGCSCGSWIQASMGFVPR